MLHRLFCTSVFLASLSLANQVLAQGLAKSGIRVEPKIAYGGPIKSDILDLYLPRSANRPVPVILWVHGGGWETGNRAHPPALFLAGKGYAVASIDYRLTGEPNAHFPAQIHDCKATVRWLRANAKQYNFDPVRIGAWGGSAGGHLVALLGTSGNVYELEGNVGDYPNESSRVQAVCDWFGPTDLERHSKYKDSVKPHAPNTITKLFGGPIGQHKKLAQYANPINHVTANSPPFLIMHGDHDTVVPLKQSERLVGALKAAGAPVDFRVVRGAGHHTGHFGGLDNIRIVEAFFNKHLGMKKKEDNEEAQEEVRLVATYTHKAGPAAPGNIKFYANGYLQSPDGPHTWVLTGNTLILYWYDHKAPGGMWIDLCTLSADGSRYRGQNQHKVVIEGEKVR